MSDFNFLRYKEPNGMSTMRKSCSSRTRH